MKYLPKNNRNFSKKPRAQAMVEFALIIPVLLLLLVGILEFGRLFYAWLILENSTRFGLRYATAGTYDVGYCPGGTPCADEFAIKNARLPSIEDETRRMLVGFAHDESLGLTQKDYLNIQVCAGEEDDSATDPIALYFNRPYMGSATRYAECTTAGGSSGGSAGDPGDMVIVAADYNFSFIVMPLFGVQPEMIHLASYRVGRNETFDTAEIVNLPSPDPSGGGFYESQTPSITPSPTNTFTPTPTSTSTPSRTPTNTSTPTNTPVPSCSNIIFDRIRFNSDSLEVRVRNNNSATAYLINSTLTWAPSPLTSPKYMDKTVFNGSNFDNPSGTTGLGITVSPQIINAASGTFPITGNGTRATWDADSNNSTWEGLWSFSLTFDFPGWGTCTLTDNIDKYTPTPTMTRTSTLTATPSRTPTITYTPSRTPSPTITYTPSRTPTRTFTPTASNTPMPSRTPTKTLVPSRTPTRTPTTVPTITLTPSRTPTKKPTNTPTVVPSSTPTVKPTNTRSCSDC